VYGETADSKNTTGSNIPVVTLNQDPIDGSFQGSYIGGGIGLDSIKLVFIITVSAETLVEHKHKTINKEIKIIFFI